MVMKGTSVPTLLSTTSISSATTVIIVPRASLSTYKEASNWSSYSSIIYADYYIVNFNDYDDSQISTQTVNYGENATAPANPTRTGYTFSSWDKAYTNITADTTITAQYTINTYTVTFKDYDGTTLNTQTVDYGSSATAPTNPTRTGYTFSSWDKAFTNITADTTITAQYTINSYTVTFKDYDGTTLKTQTVDYGASAATPANPTRTGYTFSNWDKAFTNITADTTITATYIVTEYTIQYVLNNGTVSGTNPTTYTINSSDITLINPTRDYYTFAGWTGTGLSENTLSVTIPAGSTGNRTYTANWAEINYTITYELNGGTILGTNPISYNVESSEITLINPTKTGYNFIGWTGTGLTEQTLTVTIPAGSIENRTYTANWAEINYTITYELNGGTILGTNPIAYNINFQDFTLINPTKTGYTFIGWSGTGLSENSFTVLIINGSIEDRTYTANWTINIYTVNFLNFTNEIIISESIEYGSDATPPVNPTKTGYNFTGWIGNYNNISEDINIASDWEIITYSISYNLNGGSNESNPISYTVENNNITLLNPTKIGYTFIGWTGTDLSELSLTVTIPTGSINDRTYTANWEIQKFAVSYVYYDNTIISTTNINYGSILTQPSDPEKTNCDFEDWYIDKNYSEQFIFNNSISENISLYAKFSTIATININGNESEQKLTVGKVYEELEKYKNENSDIKTGYSLVGWKYIDTVTSQEVDIKSTTNFNYNNRILILSIFEANTYTVSFNINYEDGNAINPLEITYDQIINYLPTPPIRDGYIFKGWYVGDTLITEGSIYKISDNTTLTAAWEILSFNFTWIYVAFIIIVLTIFLVLINTIRKKKKIKKISNRAKFYK